MARIVVCGAGINGLITAMMLAKDGHEVTVMERDPAPPPDPSVAWDEWERRGVGQFRLAHFLLAGFRKVVHEELPDVEEALVAGGALRMNVLGPFAEALDPEDHNVVLTARRPYLESIVAGCAGSYPGVTVRRGTALGGVVTVEGTSGPRVVGVRSEAGEEILGDLVVDVLGRRSPLGRWLADAGARPHEVEEEDSGFVYYGRHIRTGGEILRPTLDFFGSVGLLVLPAEHGVTGVALIAWSGDPELRALRHDAPWRAALSQLPNGPALLEGEALDDIAVMAGIEDRFRRFVVDGDPVATGVVSLGDAWAATNPTLGRGISIGVRHAQLLRDTLRDVNTDDHEGLVRRFDEVTQVHQTPWYRSTIWHDRHRIADFRSAIDGRDREPDEAWDRFLAFTSAAFDDLSLLPHFLDTFRLDRRPEEVLADPAVVAHMDATGLEPPEPAGPSRAELLSVVLAAGG